MSWSPRLAALALPVVLAACGEGDLGSYGELLHVERLVEPFALSPTVAETSVAWLAWHTPEEDCPQAYRLEASYEPDLKFEEDNQGGIALARNRRRVPYRKQRGDGTKGEKVKPPPGPVPRDVIIPGELYYRGFRADRVGATRDYYLSSEFLGPASPMAGCFWRTWDPMEDAFALGWPKLPGRLTAIGEQWEGLRVEAQCSRVACVDPVTGGGGPDNHFRPCATQPFRETLSGIFEIGGERFALVRTAWDDGNGGQGISAKRTTLLSVDHGRPVWTQTIVDHRFAQPTVNDRMEPIVRTWTMTAIDQCPGSLASVGWERPQDVQTLLEELREGLDTSDALRSSRPEQKGEREANAAE